MAVPTSKKLSNLPPAEFTIAYKSTSDYVHRFFDLWQLEAVPDERGAVADQTLGFVDMPGRQLHRQVDRRRVV